MATRQEFICFKCGCCCCTKGLDDLEDLAPFIDRKGKCRYFDPETKLCQIYDNRPVICNVEESFAKVSNQVRWEDFCFTNMLNCVALRYEQGVEEPEESPFKGRQEEIALKVLEDHRKAQAGELKFDDR